MTYTIAIDKYSCQVEAIANVTVITIQIVFFSSNYQVTTFTYHSLSTQQPTDLVNLLHFFISSRLLQCPFPNNILFLNLSSILQNKRTFL